MLNNEQSWLQRIVVFFLSLLFLSAQAQPSNTPAQVIMPPRLHVGDTVGLISSAYRATDDETIQFATERLQSLGLKVKYGKSIFNHDTYFAGTDQQRAADVNAMFADPEVKAIFEVRGGWGSNRILDYLDYPLIQRNPKILLGFSDITSLLLGIHARTGLVTFHSTLGAEPWPAFTVDYLKRVLFNGEAVTFKNPVKVDTDTDIIQTENRTFIITPGKARGRLLGGNLTMIASMLGSSYLPQWQGAILFIEDVGEDYYKIDRLLQQLKMAGILKQLSGVVFGQCMKCSAGSENSATSVLGSFTLTQLLNQYIKPLKIPAYYGAMIGHMPTMFTLPEGVMAEMDATQGTITLLQPAVQ